MLARILAVVYFGFFLACAFYTRLEKTQAGAGKGYLPCALRCGPPCRPGAAWPLAAAVLIGGWRVGRGSPAEAEGEAAAKAGANWQHWRADNNVTDMPSVQRGARNFTSYCLGCHSLKYERWSRLGADLAIPPDLLQKDLIPPGDKDTQYILTTMPAEDAANWFGKTPPDLSLMARARGRDYIYQFLKTFYVDPTRQTGANNLRLPTTAMPHVLSELEGLKRAVFRDEVKAEGGQRARAGVRPLRDGRPGAPQRGPVRSLRARYGQLPGLRQRTDAGGTA